MGNVATSFARERVEAFRSLGPAIETERLHLRPPIADDLDAWAEFLADPGSTRFLVKQEPLPRVGAWRTLAMFAGSWALHGFGMFSMVEKASGRCVGRVGPWFPEGWPGPEIGWGLLPSMRHRGFAREGAIAANDWAIANLGWTDIIHAIDPANAASISLAEWLGSSHRGQVRLQPPDDARVLGV